MDNCLELLNFRNECYIRTLGVTMHVFVDNMAKILLNILFCAIFSQPNMLRVHTYITQVIFVYKFLSHKTTISIINQQLKDLNI